jgi:hypothetical protein
MSGYTDSAIVHRGVLQKGIPFLETSLDPSVLAVKNRDVPGEKRTAKNRQ